MIEDTAIRESHRLKKRLTIFTWALIGAWTLAVAGSILWDERQREVALFDIAEASARARFERDDAFETWVDEVGGVYIRDRQLTESTPFVPDSHPTDYISTYDGAIYTKVSPMEMTRRVEDLAEQNGANNGRIILNHPLWAENIPNQWELEALRRIGSGAPEVSGTVTIDGEEHFSLMRPLRTDENCRECHTGPRFETSRIEGGATQSVRMAPLRAAMTKARAKTLIGHGVHWVLGLALVFYGNRRLSSEIRRRETAEKKIRHLANYDDLTDLPNRVLFLDRLRRGMARSARREQQLAILFVDLDGFKAVNDTQGHAAGDRVLVEVGRRLQDCVRETDTVARIGGDEFAVILPEIPHPDIAARIAGEILRHLETPIRIQHRKVSIGASIGISLFPDDAENGETLLRIADKAMYEVKSCGKNGFAFASGADAARRPTAGA